MRWEYTRAVMAAAAVLWLGGPAAHAQDAFTEDEVRIAEADEQAEEAEQRKAETRQRRAEAQERRKAAADERRREAEERRAEAEERRSEDEDAYDEGTEALDEERWDRAIVLFEKAVRQKSKRADGATYWKAHAQYRKGQRAEALATLAELRKLHPQSRYLDDARALEVEVREGTGQPVSPEASADEAMKILALQGLMNSDPERAVPLLEKFLQRRPSRKLQEQALFVLGQSGSPKAREILGRIARGQDQPDLQRKAIRYLSISGGEDSRRVLAEVYRSSTDNDVKKAVLQGFLVSGDKARVLELAKTEKDPDLRRSAVHLLGAMGARDEIWSLYQSESSPEVKKGLLQAMFVGGDATRLLDVARTEKDESLRRAAVRNLGLISSKQTGDALVSIYKSDPPLRDAAIEGLFLQQNASALIALSRQEKDPALRKALVQRLSIMGSKEATDYLLEILEK
jgi:hypothetical protein